MANHPELQRIEEVFSEALATPPAGRQAFLEASCGDDNALRDKVARLLAAHEHAGEFLASPTEVTDTEATLPPTTPPATPDHIGRYRIKRVIATGGMGVVYEAVQEKPHRTVALKVVRAGIASRSALRRFEYESQILARLRHPNIAQVYEAGAHDGGGGAVPFFAMEYIPNARSLVEHSSERDLNTRARLKLFIRVCHAVHHGHQKGVIHRDLKPGNILVDSAGEPKIIDFGVARATDSDMAVTTLQTDVGQLIGTLQYMSPEQCEADPHDLDSRSDVYALGVVLYELLCGQLPYDLTHAAVPEAARVIRDELPAKPSTINRTLRGDVETIVLKALEKERARRYSSAQELASDIQRYLNDLPITARPPSVHYQLAKFARRNKTLVGGVIVAFVAMILGTAVATWQAVRARAEASRAVATKEFLADMIGATDFLEAGHQPTVREILDKGVGEIEARFADHPEIEADIRYIIGRSYATMSDWKAAIEQLRSSLAIRKRVLGEEHPDTLASAHRLGRQLFADRQLVEAEQILRETLERRSSTLGEDDPDTLRSMDRLAFVLVFQGKRDEAEDLSRRAVDGLTRVLGPEHRITLEARFALIYILGASKSTREEAIELARENREIAHRTLGPEHHQTLEYTRGLGTYLAIAGRWEEAEPLLRWALETRQRLFGKNDWWALSWQEHFGSLLHRHGKTEEGERFLREAVEGLRRTVGDRNLTTSYAIRRLGRLKQDLGHLQEAEDLFREVVDIQREVLREGHPHTLINMDMLASLLAERGKLDEAQSVWRDRLDIQGRVLGDDDPNTLRSMNKLARFLKDYEEKLPEAEDLTRQATSLARSALSEDDQLTIDIADTLAVVLYLRGRNEEAILEFERVAAAARKTAGHDRWLTLMSAAYYGRCLIALERFEEAESVLLTAYNGGNESAGEALVHLYDAWGKPEEAEEYRGLPREAAGSEPPD
jgi:tetratricopeptide (TPR) repeat protein/tRNA A-37 threonylcarbamoyl transferase component Bud32